MEEQDPDKYTAKIMKVHRDKKIFVDYLRNGRGATAVVPYSLRARPISAVAMPVEWSELAKLKGADVFPLQKALEHIKKRKKDPWAGMHKNRQTIRILKE
ncbi:putative ATP-dependent DNA ligase YkoU [compost metagenome]